jgi:hypothetical protein
MNPMSKMMPKKRPGSTKANQIGGPFEDIRWMKMPKKTPANVVKIAQSVRNC